MTIIATSLPSMEELDCMSCISRVVVISVAREQNERSHPPAIKSRRRKKVAICLKRRRGRAQFGCRQGRGGRYGSTDGIN